MEFPKLSTVGICPVHGTAINQRNNEVAKQRSVIQTAVANLAFPFFLGVPESQLVCPAFHHKIARLSCTVPASSLFRCGPVWLVRLIDCLQSRLHQPPLHLPSRSFHPNDLPLLSFPSLSLSLSLPPCPSLPPSLSLPLPLSLSPSLPADRD